MQGQLTEGEIEDEIDELFDSLPDNTGWLCRSLRNLSQLRHNQRDDNDAGLASTIVALVADIQEELINSTSLRTEEELRIGINLAIDNLEQWDYHLFVQNNNNE